MDPVESFTRQQLIQAAIILTASKNPNMPAHARRILRDKFGIPAYETEIEVECSLLAAGALRDLARLTQP